MKTTPLTLFAFIIVLIFSSCEKKNYTCACTITEKSLFGSNSTTHTQLYTVYGTKRKAEKKCRDYEPSGVQIWTSTSCTLR
ncbi:MAG: hypothetical protein J0L69_00600 [Bacteroidetes bacterium]|nr:hypothetical protein [Bacteroidota bacterium]